MHPEALCKSIVRGLSRQIQADARLPQSTCQGLLAYVGPCGHEACVDVGPIQGETLGRRPPEQITGEGFGDCAGGVGDNVVGRPDLPIHYLDMLRTEEEIYYDCHPLLMRIVLKILLVIFIVIV